MQQEPNYGRPEEVREPGYSGGGMGSPVGMSAKDERTWSMLAHLSVLVNLVPVLVARSRLWSSGWSTRTGLRE